MKETKSKESPAQNEDNRLSIAGSIAKDLCKVVVEKHYRTSEVPPVFVIPIDDLMAGVRDICKVSEDQLLAWVEEFAYARPPVIEVREG